MQRNISINHLYGEAYYRSERLEIIIRDPSKSAYRFGSFGIYIMTWTLMDSESIKAELHLTIRTLPELHALLASDARDILHFISTCEHKNITMYKNGELQITGGLFEKIVNSNKTLKHTIESQWNEVKHVSSKLINDLSL